MKKRNRVRRDSKNTLRGNLLGLLGDRNKRGRKAWMFERLEDRHMFSVSPVGSAGASYESYSGVLTPEQVTMGELWWSFKQAANLSQYTTAQLQNTTQWAVWSVDPSSGNGGGASFNPYLGGTAISALDAGDMSSSEVIEQLSNADNVVAFYPIVDFATSPLGMSAIDEPLFESQWHLRNTGQLVGNPNFQDLLGKPGEDIRVIGAWNQGVSGEGVVVGVVDSGFQTNHPDLFDNYRGDLSVNFGDGSAGSHGTAVAGLIGADGNNNFGVTGVAYDVDLVNIDIGNDATLFGVGSDADLATVLSYRNDVIDIYNHSWSFAPREAVPLGPLSLVALRNSIRFGRPDASGDPLGSIHVFASGNSAGHDFPPGFPNPIADQVWDSAVWNSLINRYTIGVGGVDHDGTPQNVDGTFTNYAETGSNVLVVAPTGSTSINVGLDSGTGSGIWTTDLTGNNGYNQAGQDDGDFLGETPQGTDTNLLGFTSRFNGTSAADPQVTGVIALMLDANPDLNYRDVQEILLRSARQNDPTHESWQTNINGIFQAPAIDPLTAYPVENPYSRTDGRLSFQPTFVADDIDDYAVNDLPLFETGAGYTVSYSRGIFTEETGYAHGVVDAELAVKLAKQWHTKKQDNPAELTYTTFVRQLGGSAGTIHPGAQVGPDSREDLFIIPGIWGGVQDDPEFPEFYDEFFNDMPFTQMNPADVPAQDNGRPIPLEVFEGFTPPLMEIEWVDVKLELFDLDPNAVRVALRSPDGTISELNYFNQDHLSFNPNIIDEGLRISGLQDPSQGNPFVYTFTTNRHWGERSDNAFQIDPVTGQAAVDPDVAAGNFDFDNATLFSLSPELYRSWDLIIENYSPDTGGVLDTFEVVFHGKPLAPTSERISGKVGIDTRDINTGVGDGNFNFTRAIDLDVNNDDVIDTRIADPNQEAFANNITVTVRDDNGGPDDGAIVSQFVTGADGNFYFDLVPGQYTVEVSDPLGRSLQQDSGLNPRYNTTWTVVIDGTDAFTRVAGREVQVDEDGDGIQDFDDINMDTIQGPNEPSIFRHDYFSDVNFLLDSGDAPPEFVDVEGFVFADANINGVYDSADSEAAGFRIYADVNNSGAFELGEPSDVTGDDGLYAFTIPGINVSQNVRILAERAEAPIQGWLPTNPVTAKHTLFVSPGETFEGIDFGFRPPPDSDPNDPPGNEGDPGTISGTVYSDRNANGVRNTNDPGVIGVRVYVDADNDDQYDVGEITDFTNEFGNFTLVNVEPGSVQVDIVVPTDWILTTAEFVPAVVPDGGTVSGIKFGIQNQATRDFGDLLGPGGTDTYATTLANNGARHEIIPGFQLGSRIDGETNGQPTAAADGDDALNSDEDGVVLTNGALIAGTVNSVQVTVGGVGGYLNAWMDFDNSGTFDDDEHVVFDVDLNPGTRTVLFEVPDAIAAGTVAARFRWGTAGLNYFGQAIIGEVEDYLLPVAGGGGGGLGGGGLAAESASFVSESDDAEDSSTSLAGLQFSTEVSASESTPIAGQSTANSQSASDAELALLDQVLAGNDDDDDEVEADPLAFSDSDDNSDVGGGGLALAAAFDEVTEWRYGL